MPSPIIPDPDAWTGCKGCSADVRVPREQIDRLLDRLDAKGFPLVSDDAYRRRVNVCGDCPSLQYGTTCRHCGCLVEFRAKLQDKDCPHPAGSRWA